MGRWSDGDTSLRAFVKEPPLCTVTNMNEVGKLHLFNRKKENTFSIGIGGCETNAICIIQLLGFFWGVELKKQMKAFIPLFSDI